MKNFIIFFTKYKEIKFGTGDYTNQTLSAKDSDTALEIFLNEKKSLGEIVVVNAITTKAE